MQSYICVFVSVCIYASVRVRACVCVFVCISVYVLIIYWCQNETRSDVLCYLYRSTSFLLLQQFIIRLTQLNFCAAGNELNPFINANASDIDHRSVYLKSGCYVDLTIAVIYLDLIEQGLKIE